MLQERISILAGYIFGGKRQKGKKIAMTSPVGHVFWRNSMTMMFYGPKENSQKKQLSSAQIQSKRNFREKNLKTVAAITFWRLGYDEIKNRSQTSKKNW